LRVGLRVGQSGGFDGGRSGKQGKRDGELHYRWSSWLDKLWDRSKGMKC
jgi:hypothetical protein